MLKNHSHTTLRYINFEASYAQIFITLTGGVFITGLAILLGASDFELGLITALPFLSQVAQLLSLYLVQKYGGCKPVTIKALTWGRIVWLFLIPLLFFTGAWRLNLFLVILFVSGLLTMAVTPAWFTWMSELVPSKIRGRFFGTRNAYIAVATLIATVFGSLVIDFTKKHDMENVGFVILMVVAFIGGILAIRSMKALPQIKSPLDLSQQHFKQFVAPLKDARFRTLIIIFAAWNISIGLSAAFFAPQMILHLKMSFFLIGLYSAGGTLLAVFFNRPWGKFIDKFGSRVTLMICAFSISLVPMFWVFPRQDFLWVLIPELIYSGIVWTGFNLAAFTIPIDQSPRENRTAYLSVFAVATGLAFFVGSMLGGTIADIYKDFTLVIGPQTLTNYHILFVVSSLMRLLTALMFLRLKNPSEVHLPVIIQFMGYAVLKRLSIGRQIAHFETKEKEEEDDRETNVYTGH